MKIKKVVKFMEKKEKEKVDKFMEIKKNKVVKFMEKKKKNKIKVVKFF